MENNNKTPKTKQTKKTKKKTQTNNENNKSTNPKTNPTKVCPSPGFPPVPHVTGSVFFNKSAAAVYLWAKLREDLSIKSFKAYGDKTTQEDLII